MISKEEAKAVLKAVDLVDLARHVPPIPTGSTRFVIYRWQCCPSHPPLEVVVANN